MVIVTVKIGRVKEDYVFASTPLAITFCRELCANKAYDDCKIVNYITLRARTSLKQAYADLAIQREIDALKAEDLD